MSSTSPLFIYMFYTLLINALLYPYKVDSIKQTLKCLYQARKVSSHLSKCVLKPRIEFNSFFSEILFKQKSLLSYK